MSGVTSSTKIKRSSGASSNEVRVAWSAREATLNRRGDGDDDDCLDDDDDEDDLEDDNFAVDSNEDDDDDDDEGGFADDCLIHDNFDSGADDDLEDASFDDADAIHRISATLTPCISWCGVIDSVRRRRMKRPTLAISAARLRCEPKSATGSRRRSTEATNRHTSAGDVSVDAVAVVDSFADTFGATCADWVGRARADEDDDEAVAEEDAIPSIAAS